MISLQPVRIVRAFFWTLLAGLATSLLHAQVVELTFENSANRLAQTGSSAVTFTNQNAVTFGAGYGVGSAAVFSGTNYLLGSATPVTTAFSVTFWMKTTTTQSVSSGNWFNGAGLVDHELGGVQNDWGLSQMGSKVAFGIGNPDRTIRSTTSVNTGSWVFVAATWSASSRTARLYINGTLEATDSSTSANARLTSGFPLGADVNFVPSQGFFIGSLDEVRIYNTVLTGAEIIARYRAPVATVVVANSSLKAGQTSAVTITFSEAVTGFDNTDLTVSNGSLTTVTSSDGGITWTATFTPAASTNAATNAIILANTGVTTTAGSFSGFGTTTSANYAIETTVPTLTSVAIASNNANPAWAKVGDVVTVTFTASETIVTPTATLAGHAATATNTTGNTWTATTTMVSGDSEGAVPFNLSFADSAGNSGTAVTATTNASSVQFSKTTSVFSSSSSTTGTVGSPFTFTLTSSGTSPTFAAIGLPSGLSLNPSTGAITGTPTQGGTFIVSLTGTDPAGNVGSGSLSLVIAKSAQSITFATSGGPDTYVITPTASSGLAVTLSLISGPGSLSGNTLSILGRGALLLRGTQAGNANYLAATADFSFTALPELPTLTSVAIASNNPSPVWAKVGNTITVTFTASETIATPTVAIAGHAATVTNPSGNTWTAAYTLASGDAEGAVPFGISFSSSAGTVGTAVTATTNASSVQFSKTTPVFSSASSTAGTVDSQFTFSLTSSGISPTFAATGLPGGLSLNPSTGAITGSPTVGGTFNVSLTSTDPAGNVGSGSLSLVIAKSAQSITFATSGGPDTFVITPTASSGLAVTLSLVSGPGSLSGNTLSILGRGAVVLRGTQPGNSGYLAATADFSFTGLPQLEQTISFAPLPDRKVGDAAFSVGGSATSGLPVSFAVSGPAMLQGGSIVVLSGLAGTVTVTARQGGDGDYLPAPSVAQTFTVVENLARVFIGDVVTSAANTKAGDIAITLPPIGNDGTIIVILPGRNVATTFGFTLQPDGRFVQVISASATSTAASISSVAGVADDHASFATISTTDTLSAVADTTGTLTVRGSLVGNVLAGRFDELDLSFSLTLQARGATASSVGFYPSSALNGASGKVYVIVGNNGEAIVLVATPTLTAGGRTSLGADGSFELPLSSSSGVATVRGSIDPRATTAIGAITLPSGAAILFSGLVTTTSRNDRLINFSSRAKVGPNPLITGFVVGGGASKRVLLRAVGPTLASLGLSNALTNPRLQLYDGTGQLLLSNDDWVGSDITLAAAQTGAFPFPAGSKDAALVASLAPGSYTMHITAVSDPGVALAEIYDASGSPQNEYQRLVNISTRGEAGNGENVLTGGFIVTGNAPKKILVRGIGPGLSALGLTGFLADPRLRVYQGSTVIAENDNWSTLATDAAANADGASRAGAFALATGSKDASLVLTLAPGAYTAQVSSVDTTTGTALVEVYEIP
jgi:hypothetical protein